MLEYRTGQPAWIDVVGEVEQPADVEAAARQIEQRRLNGGLHPGEHPVAGHVVEGSGNQDLSIRHRNIVGWIGEGEEIRVNEGHVGQPQLLLQLEAVGDLIHMEIDAHEDAFRIDGGQQAEMQAHAAAQLEIAKRLTFAAGGPVALHQGSEIQPVGRHLAVEAAGVEGVGEVAVAPGGGGQDETRRPENIWPLKK